MSPPTGSIRTRSTRCARSYARWARARRSFSPRTSSKRSKRPAPARSSSIAAASSPTARPPSSRRALPAESWRISSARSRARTSRPRRPHEKPLGRDRHDREARARGLLRVPGRLRVPGDLSSACRFFHLRFRRLFRARRSFARGVFQLVAVAVPVPGARGGDAPVVRGAAARNDRAVADDAGGRLAGDRRQVPRFMAVSCRRAGALLPDRRDGQRSGDPDNGVIASGYVGAALLAGAYLAISCMTSALTRNQVIAFILAVVLCLL